MNTTDSTAKKNIALLFGGVSSEHEISLRSAACVLRNIDREKYIPHTIGITKDGRWLYYTGDADSIENNTWEKPELCTSAVISPDRSCHGIVFADGRPSVYIDVVYPVLHGKNGEDGTVQGLAMLAGIPFVGSDAMGSALCMDKAYSNAIMDYYGIPHCEWISFTRDQLPRLESIIGEFENRVGYPMIVKPANAGSSVGVSKVHSRQQLLPAVTLALESDRKVVVERCVMGREIECAVLGNEETFASGVGEILPPEGVIYTYEEKYSSASETGLAIPADIPEALAQEIRTIAQKAYRALGCGGLSRVDFFVENGRPLLNEINTLPGFTSISMYPKLMEAAGIGLKELTHRIISLALEADKERQ